MAQISDAKKKELFELVEKQKKAKINWVSVITQLSEEEVKTAAWEIGLVIDNDHIMLPSETTEGKKETQIQKNTERLLKLALDERVLRDYHGGGRGEKSFSLGSSSSSSLGGAGMELALIGIVAAAVVLRTELKDPSKMKFGTVSTCVCRLDGSIKYLVSKADEMVPVKDRLFQDIESQYDQNFHYLVPIKIYFEMLVIPKIEDKSVSDNLKKILSLCELLDKRISDFCMLIADKSVSVTGKKLRKTFFDILMTNGKRVETPKKFIELSKYSLYLCYRTQINQLFYEMTQTKQMPGLVESVLNNQFSDNHFLEKSIQYLFQEFADGIVSQGLNENAEIIKSILSTF